MRWAFIFAFGILSFTAARAQAPASRYAEWQHHGDLAILTTHEGAHLPSTAKVEDFPVLVRLNSDFFDFHQAQAHGEDVRFTSAKEEPLPYEIEEWDQEQGTASIWVRIPLITGGSYQPLHIHWGNAAATNESNGVAVFNASNGYLSVWHMNSPVRDVVGTLETKNTGAMPTNGVIGPALHFERQQGLFGGDKIPNYPAGDHPSSTEIWFRAPAPNATIIGWGNEGTGRGCKVQMQFRSPPHIHIDSDFSDVNSDTRLPMNSWVHVVHTYDHGESRIYLNGKLDASAQRRFNIQSPSRLWIGGWYHHYEFVGDIDEVRISNEARSPEWIQLEYENQKPLQTLVGPVQQPGAAFSVTPTKADLAEKQSITFTAQAGGAQRYEWVLSREGHDEVVATDQLTYSFSADRVASNTQLTLVFRAICDHEVKTQLIPISIRKTIEEPDFTLEAPATWDGRTPFLIVPRFRNLTTSLAQGADDLRVTWDVGDLAVTQKFVPDQAVLTQEVRAEELRATGHFASRAVSVHFEPNMLMLMRAQNGGPLHVSATADNGGARITRTVSIAVTEPPQDPWVQPSPEPEEKPESGQFIARDSSGDGLLHYNGHLPESAPLERASLKVYRDNQCIETQSSPAKPDRSYAFSVHLKAVLAHYKVELVSGSGDQEKILEQVDNLVCGDAYLINGQSNAEAVQFGKADYPFTSEWIRSYGSTSSGAAMAHFKGWGPAVARGPEGRYQLGYWGLELARRLMESEHVPICILNGAVGGTRIDQHQRNAADPADVQSIYGRLLWRAEQAHLTHGIRAILWHQGENDQGADGPTGAFGWETYRQYFLKLAAAWKQDYPNLQHYYVFQIWPRACSMGINGSDNRLREVQRNLPSAFAHLSLMSTLGIEPPSTCHYEPAGYAEMARLIFPLLQRDIYRKTFPQEITPPNLRSARRTSQPDEIELTFDQPVIWDDHLCRQLYLDGQKNRIISGTVQGNVLTLKASDLSHAEKITYLDSANWSQKTLLWGVNGIAALTFCEVPIAPPSAP